MKNLKILVNLKHSIDLLSDCEHFTLASSDVSNNVFERNACLFIYKKGDIFKLIPSNGECFLLFSIKPTYNDDTNVVAFFYNSLMSSLNIVMEKGDILTMSLGEDYSPMDEIQCIEGFIGDELKAAYISPDMEIVIILTCDILTVMDSDFVPIRQSNLFATDRGEQEMVNVGWGKKETQFHGSEGKAAAKKTVSAEESILNSNIPEEEKSIKISWRGDSELFAVSYFCEKKHRKIKIYDKYGILQCTSEYIPGLEGSLSWRPSGNLIALTQQLPNKYVVCFMEKNGLRHGDLILPPHIKVLELSWNSESTILSAVCRDESLKKSCVLLWSTRNYHWYLKQNLAFESTVVAFTWDDVVGNLAYILLADGQFLVHQWTWTVDHSAGLSDDDLAAVAVIDGCDLKLSAFKKCIIPPPMCGATVVLPCPVLQVFFSPFCGNNRIQDNNPNDVCAYLSNGNVAIIKDLDTAPQIKGFITVKWKSVDLPSSNYLTPSSLSHWLWLSPDQLLCIASCSSSNYLCHLHLENESASVLNLITMEEAVLTISKHSGASSALIQLRTGELLEFQDGCLLPLSKLPEPCTAVRCFGPHIFARTHNCRLYADGELIASNVTSFFCLPQFLITTLSNHQLCVASSDNGFKVEAGSERRVERGSLLVVAVGHSVVLQMPRGNLETVQPRALTIESARRLLDAGNYAEVARLLRRQRIDLNLVVDHNPAVFLVSAARLVAQVRDAQWLSVFLAELSERDVSLTVYAAHYKNVTNRGPPLADKVARVCSALREAMSRTAEDREFFLQPILSTFVREGRVGEAIATADSDMALGFLTLLIDSDRLYEEALASYNLDKALRIAGKSSKDPKEYVAYLNELQAMDPNYMRFTIDKRMRKPESALRHLAQCADRREECLQFVNNNCLYSLALQLFKKSESDSDSMHKDICRLYGGYLEQKKAYQEAAVMCRRADQMDKSLAMYAKAGCWRQCLTLAAQLDYCDSDLDKLHEQLYSALVGSQQQTEAALLSAQLGWLDKAISCWAEARRWQEAVHLCQGPYLVLLESVVKPTLEDCQRRTVADLRSKIEEMEKLTTRLLVVKNNKANQPNYNDASDIQSDTSSLSSFSTSSGGTRSTKNTRKAQRKLWSLKEGNPREEQALLYTITELIRNTERLTGEVHSSCLALCELDMDDAAKMLQATMAQAIDKTQHVRLTVWPTHSVKKTGSDADAIDPVAIDTQLNYPPTSCIDASWKIHIYS